MNLLDHLTFVEPERYLATALTVSYDVGLVLISILISVVSAYSAFLAISRVQFSTSAREVWGWRLVGALSLGVGIWSMHFIGMLAYVLPISVSYDTAITVVSVIPAVLASLIVLQSGQGDHVNVWTLTWRSVLMGSGIGLMHYTGMAAMHMEGVMRYDPWLFSLSIAVAVVLSAVSLALKHWAFSSAQGRGVAPLRLAVSSIVMGAAVSSMHYTGMAAVYTFPGAMGQAVEEGGWSIYALASVITAVSISLSVSFVIMVGVVQRFHLRQKIKVSESRQSAIVEVVADGIIAISYEGVIESFNPAAEKIFGYREDEIVGADVSILLPEEERAEHKKYTHHSQLHSARVLNNTRDLYGRRKDGSLFPLELTVTPLRSGFGRGFVGVVRDITERVKTQEEATRRNNAQRVLADILSASLEPISLKEFLQKSIDIMIETSVISTKPAGAIFLANEESETLVMAAQKGLNPILLGKCGKLKYGTCHCGMAAQTREIQFADCIDDRHVIQFDGMHPHGHYCVPIRFQSRLLGVFNIYLDHGHQPKDDEREFLSMLANTLAGIIDRRLAEKELIGFKTTLDLTLDCVFMFSPDDLKFFYVNSGALEQVGYSKEELMSMTPYDIKPDYDEASFRALLKPMLKHEQERIHFETIHQHKDGHLIPVAISLQYVVPSGQTPRFVAIVQDITERQRIDKIKNEFVSTVSHELRTPLTSIRGALGLIAGGAVGEIPEKAQSLLAIANSNTERLLLLINDILDIQKIESGEMQFKLQRVDVLPFIEKCVQDNMAYGEQYGVRFEIKQRSEAAVYVDPDRLGQVMGNLLSNAVKFSHRDSVVELGVESQGKCVRLFVRDHGDGIPAEFQSKLFDKFSQADSTDTRKVGGTGLGLSIVKTLIEKQGGAITFESAEGEGSCFYIELPQFVGEVETPAQLSV